MAYRTVSLANGDTVRISESVLRGAGPDGPIGPTGPPGTATTIRGSYATYAALVAAIPTGKQGDGYIALDTGNLWVWDTLKVTPSWVDCGRIVGPAANMAVGAQRTRTTVKAINANTYYTVQYETTSNDSDGSGGNVLHTTLTTDVNTVPYATSTMYYLVTTTFTVAASVYNPTFTVEWLNTTPEPDTVSATGNEQALGAAAFVVQHTALLKTSRTDVWQLRVKPSDTATISNVVTTWARIGGGPGPTGPAGPAPVLTAGTTTKIAVGGNPTFAVVQTSPGNYRIDTGLVTGATGATGSGYATFDAMAGVAVGASENDPGGAANLPDSLTDQLIAVPDAKSLPVVPWYMRSLVMSFYRRLVSRVTTAERTARAVPAVPDGEMVFDTTEHALYIGTFDRAGANPTWQRIPSSEYGQSGAVVHDAATTRVDGSLYFKYDS